MHKTNNARTVSSARTLWRWLVIPGVLLGFLAGYLLNAPARSSRPQSASAESFADFTALESMPTQPSPLRMPADSLSPKQVVEIQMEAMSAYRHHRAAIHQVFAHASPCNRAVTGPLEKFEQMLLQPEYRALVTSKRNLVGKAIERGKVAVVLVTTISGQGDMSVFRFLLSRQSGAHAGCWMTDGVFLLVGNWRPGESLPSVEAQLLESI